MTATTDPIVPEPARRPSARLRFGVAFLIGLVLTFGLGAGGLYAYDQQYAGRILPGVSVGGVDLSGLTPDAARAALDEAYRGAGDGRIVVTGPDSSTTITFAEIGRRVDTDALVTTALGVGRDGSAIDRAVANARTALRGIDVAPRVTFDANALADRIRTIAEDARVDPAEASASVTADLQYVVTAGHAGRTVDPTAAIDAVVADLTRLDGPTEIAATLPVEVIEPTVTTDEAKAAVAAAESIVADITLVVEDKKVSISTKRLRALVDFGLDESNGYVAVIDTDGIPGLLKGMAKKVDQEPINASFKTKGSRISGVTPSKNGYAFDAAATAAQIEALLAARANGATGTEIRPALTVTNPVLTTAQAKAARPKMTLISKHTTYFPVSEKNGFGANIWIPALTIDGYVVGPREKFDFWEAVGPVSRAKGYRQGGAIINGKTEPQGALAGGICTCSTTLFNAALKAGFEMGARRNHYYYIDRYPLGLDATVFISSSGSVQTMSFTNDTDYPILIRGYKIANGSAGYVRFELYSVPNGRQVIIGNPIVKNVLPATDSTQYTSSLAPGVSQRIEYPVDGKQVWRTITVKDAKGKVISRTTYYSNYSRITGIVLVGKGSAKE
nr:VanW family protein [Chloroflexota bacterium]